MALNALRGSKMRVLDVETSGIDRWKSHIVGWVFTTSDNPIDSFYIPVRHAAGGNLPGCTVPQTADGWDGSLHPVEREIAIILSNPNHHTLAHNIQFDAWHSRKHGVQIAGRWEDTQLNQSLINEHSRSFALEACCEAMGVPGKKGGPLYEFIASKFGCEPTPRSMAHYWRTNAEDFVVHDYAAGDGTSTWVLREAQRRVIEEEYKNPAVWDIECRCLRPVHEMIWRGIRVDEERLEEVLRICQQKRDSALNALPSGLNIRSPAQLKKLFDDNGYTDYPKTEKGNASFTEAYLKQNELGKKVVAVREFSTMVDSFLLPMKEKHLHGHRIRPWYNQSRDDQRGTITGRFSSSEPNSQQFAKRKPVTGRLLRSILIPDEGKIWASVDYSQAEPRLLAHFMCRINPDNVLAWGYRQDPPVDAHSSVAKAAGIDRDSGKRINQAQITGAGKAKIVKELGERGKTEAEALKVYEDYFKGLPELRPLQRETSAVYRSRGYLVSMLGRRMRLDDVRFDYKGLNRILQTNNAEMIKLKMVEISEYLDSENSTVELLTTIHDAFDIQFEEHDRKVYSECIHIMQSFGPEDKMHIRVPVLVDAKEGYNWAVATFGDDDWQSVK